VLIQLFFRVRSCKDFPSTWSGIYRTRKWQVTSSDSQCIAAQVCSVYDTDPQKDEGCASPSTERLLKIPHFLQIIKHPMDFSTSERKLLASNTVKPDPNTANPRCISANEFVPDVRLIFSNYVTFNGPEAARSCRNTASPTSPVSPSCAQKGTPKNHRYLSLLFGETKPKMQAGQNERFTQRPRR